MYSSCHHYIALDEYENMEVVSSFSDLWCESYWILRFFFCHWKFNKILNKFYHPSPHSTLIFTCYWMFPRQVTRFPTLYPMVQMKYSKSLTFLCNGEDPCNKYFLNEGSKLGKFVHQNSHTWGGASKQAIMCWDQSSNARESF